VLLELIETAGKVLVESGFTISQRITKSRAEVIDSIRTASLRRAFASLTSRTRCAIGHIQASWKGSKLDKLQAAPTNSNSNRRILLAKPQATTQNCQTMDAQDEYVVVEALSSMGSGS
jgi:hypothetical protein